MDCTIYVAKTKALISFAVTAKLICVFVFAYAKHWFFHDAAHFLIIEGCFLSVLHRVFLQQCAYDYQMNRIMRKSAFLHIRK